MECVGPRGAERTVERDGTDEVIDETLRWLHPGGARPYRPLTAARNVTEGAMAVPPTTAAASPGRRLDRDQVLARVELRAVADSLLGPAARQGRQLRWPCPHPEHPAPTSDRSGQPTLKITGPQTWTCQAEGCDAWGSAIDLVMHTQGRSFREALRILDEHAGAFRTRQPRPASQGGRVQRLDLAQLKARVDLVELADRLLGPGKGRRRGRGWPCPHPQHPAQTGRTPPLKIKRGSDGLQRWKCFGCGARGDAIDLVELTLQRNTGEAIRYLRDLVGDRTVAPPPRRPVPPAPRRAKPSPVLGGYVDQCQKLLWSDTGAVGRDYLMKRRGLSAQILRANRVGYDPGPA
ncbi:MAG: hypothetical protein GEV12_23990, partial [Micromonosporaceae bacterium]|nr:hypothetical protein [Micromonosporaceae bacterium]